MEDSRFSNYYDNVTTLHPLAGGMLVVASILVFVLPRRQMFLPMILLTVFVPAAQRLVIGGLDFHFMRLMVLFGWLRLFLRGETVPLKMTRLDWMMIAWTVARLLAVVARRGSPGALVNQLGQGFDTLGIYLLGRVAIRSWKDFDALVVSLIWASIPTFAFSTYEVISHRNPFHIFGQSLEEAIVRDGRVRARGAFSHQILAGVYWAGVQPLVVGRFMRGRGRFLSAIGIICCVGGIINCSSSTPLLGTAIACLGGAFWLLRNNMRQVRWAIVVGLLLVQLSMNKPIWHLLYRAGAVGLGASTGFHRYRLVQAFVDHFKQWALVGVNSTGAWGRQLEDVTNHFISQGVKGGLVTFVLFLAVYVYAYKQTGWVIHASERSRKLSFYAWSLGVAVLAHTAMMFATSYFGQVLMPWYLTFGAIGSLSAMTGPVLATAGGARSRPKKRRAKASGQGGPRRKGPSPPTPPRREPSPDGAGTSAPGPASLGTLLER